MKKTSHLSHSQSFNSSYNKLFAERNLFIRFSVVEDQGILNRFVGHHWSVSRRRNWVESWSLSKIMTSSVTAWPHWIICAAIMQLPFNFAVGGRILSIFGSCFLYKICALIVEMNKKKERKVLSFSKPSNPY